jgi:hypothetical protein
VKRLQVSQGVAAVSGDGELDKVRKLGGLFLRRLLRPDTVIQEHQATCGSRGFAKSSAIQGLVLSFES